MTIEIGTMSDLPDEVLAALEETKTWAAKHRAYSSAANAAYTYIRAIPLAIEEFGTRGAKTQLLYVTANLGTWRGDEARRAKATLNLFINSMEKM
jgi:hypothetical protein